MSITPKNEEKPIKIAYFRSKQEYEDNEREYFIGIKSKIHFYPLVKILCHLKVGK